MAKEPDEVEKPTPTRKTKSRKGWKIAKLLVVLALIVGLAGFGGFYYKKYTDLKRNPMSAEQAQKQENARVIAQVKKLYTLPENEEPTIFFVSDKDKLSEDYKKQEFFQKAINGDYILIYEQAKIALLYRQSENRLVDVRPYTVQNTLSIAIIGVEANRTSIEALLKATYKTDISITTKSDAKNQYTGNTVVDLSGKYAAQAKKIAETLKGKVATMPDGETKPANVDILVIAGSSQAAPEATPAQ